MIDIASAITVSIVAVLHILFFVMESLCWKVMAFRFGYNEIQTTKSRVYNPAVAICLIYFCLYHQYKQTTIMVLSSVICFAIADIIGSITAKWAIFIIQGLPAIIALIVVIFLMDDIDA
eukprot:201806_1